MSITFSPASIGATGVKNPELATSFRRAQWRMLLAAMFCYLFFYTGRQTFGFAIPGIQAEFGVTKAALGWASAALLWCYAVGQAINGNLGDKFGGRRVMSAGAVLSFIMNWATSLSTGIVSLSVCWGINGYFQAMGWAPGRMSKPSFAISSRKSFVFASSLSRNAVDSVSISSTFSDAPTMLGARVFENKYGRERWRRYSMISLRPLV